jgi:hypothetical protein
MDAWNVALPRWAKVYIAAVAADLAVARSSIPVPLWAARADEVLKSVAGGALGAELEWQPHWIGLTLHRWTDWQRAYVDIAGDSATAWDLVTSAITALYVATTPQGWAESQSHGGVDRWLTNLSWSDMYRAARVIGDFWDDTADLGLGMVAEHFDPLYALPDPRAVLRLLWNIRESGPVELLERVSALGPDSVVVLADFIAERGEAEALEFARDTLGAN